jgi:myo-inositol 2-dehydrogenase / D-chiro-inositol 1-dehydrogenase
MEVTLKVGVIGTGNIGADHVRRLASQLSGVRVSAVFDVATERAGQIAEGVGAIAHGSWTALVDDPDVEAIVIASPGPLHAEQVLACIEAGKPVLCEKPLATTGEDALKVIEAEVAFGRRLVQVGFMRRYDRAYRVVKAAIDDGSIGEPLLAHMVHRNASVPDSFTSDMAMTDSVIHEIDTVRWLFGQDVVATTVVASRPSPQAAAGLRDPQLVLFELADGAVVDVEVFVNCQYGYDVRAEIVGSTGTVSMDNPSTNSLRRNGALIESVPADWRVRFDTAYLDELQQWVDALAADVVSGPSAWDGYAAAVVANCAVQALADGARTKVTMVDRPSLYA